LIYSVKIDIDAFNDIQEISEWYEMQLNPNKKENQFFKEKPIFIFCKI